MMQPIGAELAKGWVAMRTALRWSDFEIEAELGAGQAGIVHRARLKRQIGHLPEGEVVAVKRYKRWLLEQTGQYERIFRELEAGRKVSHPALVRTIGVVSDDQGRPALVMQHYEGELLQAFLDRHRASATHVETPQMLAIIRSLAGALNALHEAGLIHRDVKPANVMITPEGAVLMDLGVVSSSSFAHETTTSEFLGTIRYAAPEYLFGEEYDHRSDIFSLGAIVYEMLHGKQFQGTERNWAGLVASRLSFLHTRNGYGSFMSFELREFLERIDLNTLLLIGEIMGRSLSDPKSRDLNLPALTKAIEDFNSNEPFHFVDGRFVLGAPLFRPLNDFGHSPGSRTLEEVVGVLKRRLSEEERSHLRKLLVYNYVDEWPLRENCDALIRGGLLMIGQAEDGPVGTWHPAVKYAYRYGLL